MTTKSPLVALNVLKKICDHPRLLSTRACAQLGIQGDEGLDDDILETEEGNLSAVTRIQHVADDILINESGKLLFLVKLLDRLKQEGHRCLVFSQSRKMLDIMQKVISNRGHKIMRLDGTIGQVQEREIRIQKFQTDSSYSVFLLTTQVGGVGLTLTAADRVVIFDPSWNPATDAQAVDRVFRIGQDKNVVIYRLITCGTVEEKIYRRQIFKDSITRQTTGNSKNPYRYFSKYELRELFTLDDPHSSTTQQQLEQMHSGQRLTDPSLDEHIAYLYSLDMFGLSDHDLMFSHGSEAGDQQDEEDHGEEPENDYIQHRVQKAREIIQMESSQPCTFEERMGKTSQLLGGGNDSGGGGGGNTGRNQFSNWDFPKPGMSPHDESPVKDEDASSVDSSQDSYASEDSRRNHNGVNIDLTDSPRNKVKQEPAEMIDLTSPQVKQEVKQEVPTREMDGITTTPIRKMLPNSPLNLKSELMDTDTNSPIIERKSFDSSVIYKDSEPMEIGTPKQTPLKERLGDSNLTHGGEMSLHENETPSKSVTPRTRNILITPKSGKNDRSIIHEEIIISPDASRPLIQTRPPSTSNLSIASLTNASTFQPKFNSTIFGAVDSPNVEIQSHNSKNSPGLSPGCRSKNSSLNSPSRQPFQALVEESPDTSIASSGKHRQFSGKSSSSEENDTNGVDPGENIEDSAMIDDSVVVSEGEEKENIEPGNVSVRDIRGILQKSLCNNAEDSFQESPVLTKSRRKSTAFRRRVIESSDEEDQENDAAISNSLPEIDYAQSNSLPEIDYAQSNEESPQERAVEEEVMKSSDDAEGASDIERTEKRMGVINYGNLGPGDDETVNHVKEEMTKEENEGKESDKDTENDDIEYIDENDEENENVNDDSEAEDDKASEDVEEVDEDDDELSDEETGDESEEEEFECLPETEQIRYNELVEAGRIYCQNKQYEEGQACVLQALEIFADPELQATSQKLQQKIFKLQKRREMEQEQKMET